MADILPIVIRVNVDRFNADKVDELFDILETAGLTEKIEIYSGHLIKVDDGVNQPSATYQNSCFTANEYSAFERQFNEKAINRGFSTRILDAPILSPCMAMRRNEYVIGSRGEMYKCWKSVGIGTESVVELDSNFNVIIKNNKQVEEEKKWLGYSPFDNAECTTCNALPVCMGGCAKLAMDPKLYPDRCNTFRFESEERVLQFVEHVNSSTSKNF